jgi:hypothetical protein
MEYLSEDPTYLAGGLAVLAGVFLIAMRVTQQGKFLLWAGVSLSLSVLVVGVERLWVTDNERIEQVVYDLGQAVREADAPAALAEMTDDVHLIIGGNTFSGETTRALVEERVSNSRFEFLRITHLVANAGGQSRRGTAEFRVLAGGDFRDTGGLSGAGTGDSSWSLGFRETSPGVWKVNRISPLQLPGGIAFVPPGGGGSRPPQERPPAQGRPGPVPRPRAFYND